jgi:hypothetical protein
MNRVLDAWSTAIFFVILVILPIGCNDMAVDANIDLQSGLVCYLPFSGNADDASGNSFNGVVVGATPTYDRYGQANSAYEFNGVNSYIRLGDILDSVFCKPIARFSVAGWAKTRTRARRPSEEASSLERRPAEASSRVDINGTSRTLIHGYSVG